MRYNDMMESSSTSWQQRNTKLIRAEGTGKLQLRQQVWNKICVLLKKKLIKIPNSHLKTLSISKAASH